MSRRPLKPHPNGERRSGATFTFTAKGGPLNLKPHLLNASNGFDRLSRSDDTGGSVWRGFLVYAFALYGLVMLCAQVGHWMLARL